MLAEALRAVDRRIGLACAIAAVAATLAPFLVARDLPLTDLPNHLAAVAVWHHYDDARFGFHQYYTVDIAPVPYLTHYGVVHLLAYVMPIRAANAAFVAFGALALPAGLLALLRAHGRPPLLALAGFPLFWSFPLAFGFVNFACALGPLFYACALLARLADARPWAPPRLVWANLLLGFVLYFFHHLPFLIWLVAVAIYLPRRAWWIALPPLLLFAWALGQTPAVGPPRHPDVGPELHFRFISLHMAREQALRWVLDFLSSEARTRAAIVLIGAWVGAQLLVRRDPAGGPDRRPWALLGALVALYFLLPLRLFKPMIWENVSSRLPSLIAPAAFLCTPRGTLTGWRKYALLLPLAGLAVLYPATVARKFHAFDQRAADFREVVSHLPYDPSVLTLVFDGSDPANQIKNDGPWLGFGAYVQVDRGGYYPRGWDLGFPMKQRPKAKKLAPSGFRPRDFRWDVLAPLYDYFLTRAEPPDFWQGKPVELVVARGAWKLYKKRTVPE